MSMRFNLNEVMDMAAQIERNGVAFYRNAAENAENDKAREFLITLAEEEDEHLAIFRAMKKILSSRDFDSELYDTDGQALLYIKSIASGHVFDLRGQDTASILSGDETLTDVIKIALRAEKDTIAFFVGLKELIPDETEKEKVNVLIKEETKHIVWLNQNMKAENN